jgi:hypothetical protein
MKSMFHKITVAYPVATNMTSEQTFCFTSREEALAFRNMAHKQGYKIVLHNFDYLMRATDALSEINIDMELTASELARSEYEEHYNG